MSEGYKIWNEGTTQRARRVQALTQQNFNVDERHFEVLVKYLSDYSEHITFYGLDNKPDGSWQRLINADEIVALAQLLQLNVKGIENEYYALTAQAGNDLLPTQSRYEALESALKVTNNLFSQLSKWYGIMRSIPKEAVHFPIYKEWNSALQALKGTQELQSFDPEEFMDHYEELEEEKKKSALKKLSYFFKQLIKTILFLNSQYNKFLTLSKKHQSHLPHHALIFAFLELLEYAKKSINSFHQRHLDYYYGDQLHLKPRPAKPDLVTLQFELEDDFESFLIPKKTAFLAGQDDEGKDLIYQTTEEIEVNKSTVGALKGIFVSRYSEQPGGKNPHVNLIRAADYAIKEDNEPWSIMNLRKQNYGNHQQDPEIGFALSSPELALKEGVRTIKVNFDSEAKNERRTLKARFAKAKKGRGKTTVARILERLKKKQATIRELFDDAFEKTPYVTDFVVSENFIAELLSYHDQELANRAISEFLINDEGEEDTGLTIQQLVDKLSKEIDIPSKLTFPDLINQLMGEDDPDLLEKKFKKTLKDAFKVKYTTTEGWFEVQPVSVTFADNRLEYILVLQQSFPAMEVNGESRFEQPTLKFQLNPNAAFYGYDFFERLQISKISCDINVKNVRDLVLYNQIGPVNGDGPFLPFGPAPNNYSYLLIGNKEIFRKQFLKLRLNIEWMDLPNDAGGFESYYALYDQKINNQSFKARLSNLADGEWVPKEDVREELTLFEGKNVLKNRSQFHLDTTKLSATSDYKWQPEELEYTGMSQRGFLKMHLTAPEFSFGHQQYPNLLSKMAIENARSMTGLLSGILKKKTDLPMPNQPYTPKIDKLSVDYISSFEIKFDNTIGLKKNKDHSFFHLLPFQGLIKNPVQTNGLQLIPSFHYEGALFIGIKDFSPPGTLTLFFNLKETDSVQDPDPQGKGELDWHILHGNEWVRLKPQQVSSDTTDNFLHTGIVKLDITVLGRSRPTTVMEEGLFWIMVSSGKNTHIMGEVIDIYTHAVVAQFVPGETGSVESHSIGPDTISAAVNDLPAIKTINQPLKSFGGLGAEEKDHFYIRVSERLRHKNRCVNAYDYERMILEAFPEISKVLCIDSYDWKTNQPMSGKVLIVLVPMIDDLRVTNVTTPSASVKTLRRVRALLRSKISPFVEVDVINPEYEHMRVFADVKFVSGKSSGHYLKKLNEELRGYIAPWIIDPMAEPLFQRRFPIEDIQSFIQSRKYVEFVTKVSSVKVDRTYDEPDPTQTNFEGPYAIRDTGMNLDKDNETKGRYPWSIITTAQVHQLINVDLEKPIPPDHAGYEELYLNEDFVIREDTDN